MTENRLERIINQLADLSYDEQEEIIARINYSREEKKRQKVREATEKFWSAVTDLALFDYRIYVNEVLLIPKNTEIKKAF